jgi:CubicO group peptidase (beta-lactamase class C family)
MPRLVHLFVLALLPLTRSGPHYDYASLREIVDRELSKAGAPGAAVAIIRGGTVVFEHGFGQRRRNGGAVGIHTHFEIGSDTKQFTACAILQLKERGLLALDERLAKYVPEFPHAKAITLRELLDQTSGLPDFVMTNHFVQITQTSTGSFARIETMASGPLHFSPGSRWEYSNSNYVALGRVIEVVSREPYQRYVRDHLFAPARMRESGFISEEGSFPDMATGYWRGLRGGRVVTAPEIGESWTRAAGDIVATVDDFARWDVALERGKVIDRGDLRDMMSPATLSDGKKDDYGFGWWIDPVRGYTDVYHDGDTYGMSSSNNIVPALHLDIIVLENESMDTASDLARAILSALRPSTLRGAPPAA